MLLYCEPLRWQIANYCHAVSDPHSVTAENEHCQFMHAFVLTHRLKHGLIISSFAEKIGTISFTVVMINKL